MHIAIWPLTEGFKAEPADMSLACHALYVVAPVRLLNGAPTSRTILGLVLAFPLEKHLVALWLCLILCT